MDKKLTLSLDQRVIEKAKNYAKKHQTSLSRMIEAYFDSLTGMSDDHLEITTTPLVESLCGVVELPDNFDYKEARKNYLNDKHK
ncbi:MAG: DUF6364 family protein [Flavobacteriales bacterium]